MTSAQAQADLDKLIEAVLYSAERSLAIDGDFYPFGVLVAADDGGLEHFAAADPETPDVIWSIDALDMLYRNARRFARNIRAVAFAAHVEVDGRPVVRIELENRKGQPATVLVPSQPTRPWIRTGEMTTTTGQARIWGRRRHGLRRAR